MVTLVAATNPNTAGAKAMSIVHTIINYVYLGLLAMCFILALGNRPQGSKWGYTTAMIGFAFITVYMTVRRSLFH
jgi:chitin synthase